MKSELDKKSANAVRRRYQLISMIAWGIYCLAVAFISGWFGWEPPTVGVGLYLTAILPALPVGRRHLRDGAVHHQGTGRVFSDGHG
jgi:hypothetical protein